MIGIIAEAAVTVSEYTMPTETADMLVEQSEQGLSANIAMAVPGVHKNIAIAVNGEQHLNHEEVATGLEDEGPDENNSVQQPSAQQIRADHEESDFVQVRHSS